MTFNNSCNFNIDPIPWTPTIVGSGAAGTATYSIQVGYFQRIGNVVFLYFNLAWTGHTGTGQMLIETLPVAPNNTTNLWFTNTLLSSGITYPASRTYLVGDIRGNISSTRIFIDACGSGVASDIVGVSAAGTLIGTMVYAAL